MAKRTNIVSGLGSGARVAVGIAAGKFVSNRFLAGQDPLIGIGAQVGLALVVSSMAKGRNRQLFQDLSTGMYANAFVSTLNTFAPQVTTQLGISGIGQAPFSLSPGSEIMPGVAGRNGKAGAGGTAGKYYDAPVTYSY